MLGIFCLVALIPTLTKAADITIPDGVIGITEETYHELKNAQCNADVCDAIIQEFAGKIVMRVEQNGELYRVNEGDGLPVLTRYLPDGFYQAGQKYYWLNNGTKVELKKGKAFKKILTRIQNGDSEITAISNDNFSKMLISCENYSGNPTDSNYMTCLEEYNIGKALKEKLTRKIIILPETNGVLYYVYPNNNGVVNLTKRINGVSFYKFIKNNSIAVNKQLMHQIPII